MIRLTRHHNTDIDPGTAGNLQGIKNRLVRYKIGGLDIYMILGAVYQSEIVVVDGLCLRIRSAGDDLYGIPAVSYICLLYTSRCV